jgi:tetratricopeptide (TPR) repeat protein
MGTYSIRGLKAAIFLLIALSLGEIFLFNASNLSPKNHQPQIFIPKRSTSRANTFSTNSTLYSLPDLYSEEQIESILKEKLSEEELNLIENPYEISPNLRAYVEKITQEINTELGKIKAIYHAIIDSNKLNISPFLDPNKIEHTNRTSIELFNDAIKEDQTYAICEETENLFIAMVRVLGLPVYPVEIFRDFRGNYVNHICGGVVINGKLILVDPTYKMFDIKHMDFRVVSLIEGIASHHVREGQLFLALDELEEAEKHIRLALKIDPRCGNAHVNLGIIYSRRGNNRKAIKSFKEAIALEGIYPAAHLNLFLAYEQLHMYEDALKELKTFHKYISSYISFPEYLERLTKEITTLERISPLFEESRKELILQNIKRLLHSQNPNIRRSAARFLGEWGDISAIPALIKALGDKNREVRFFSSESLKVLTGQDFGFNPNDTEENRKKSIKRWQEWWAKEESKSRRGDIGKLAE